jgi:hypothetical protein
MRPTLSNRSLLALIASGILVGLGVAVVIYFKAVNPYSHMPLEDESVPHVTRAPESEEGK